MHFVLHPFNGFVLFSVFFFGFFPLNLLYAVCSLIPYEMTRIFFILDFDLTKRQCQMILTKKQPISPWQWPHNCRSDLNWICARDKNRHMSSVCIVHTERKHCWHLAARHENKDRFKIYDYWLLHENDVEIDYIMHME